LRIEPLGPNSLPIEVTAEERLDLDAAQLLATASLQAMPTLPTCSSGLHTARKTARRCPKGAERHHAQRCRSPLHFDLD
jgi:hypothetical protein